MSKMIIRSQKFFKNTKCHSFLNDKKIHVLENEKHKHLLSTRSFWHKTEGLSSFNEIFMCLMCDFTWYSFTRATWAMSWDLWSLSRLSALLIEHKLSKLAWWHDLCDFLHLCLMSLITSPVLDTKLAHWSSSM